MSIFGASLTHLKHTSTKFAYCQNQKFISTLISIYFGKAYISQEKIN